MASPWRRVAANLMLFLAAGVLGLLLTEAASRLLAPIAPGSPPLSLDGRPLSGIPQDGVFRQVSADFDVRITMSDGYRAPRLAGQPEAVFIGDSFTFGDGLEDDQTLVNRYCRARRLACANLGWGGTGTAAQLDRLEHYLDHRGWRPRQVVLVILAMTSALMAGNDLLDNLEAVGADSGSPSSSSAAPGLGTRLLALRRPLLAHSNLVRLVYYRFGPWLRTHLSPEPAAERLAAALRATATQLARLEALSRRYGFESTILVVHPMQDIMKGSDRQTLAAIRALADGTRVIGSAEALRDAPQRYYYFYDGHPNPLGSRRIADLLLENLPPP